MKMLLNVLWLIVTTSSLVLAQQDLVKSHTKGLSCKTCHTCEVPTKDEPCLIVCPREKIATVYQAPEQTPELIVIDQIIDRYSPVYFSHKIHAQMSIMSGGCENCHHHNTSGPILQCKSCHEPNRKRDDVSLPDLKGAYHRQCMDCHRAWSHETGCNSCHELKSKTDSKNPKSYAGKSHPALKEPNLIMYETTSDKGKLVTFYHDEHVKKFGLTCVTCHKQENCTKCHDAANKIKDGSKKISHKKNDTFEEQHQNCLACHKKEEDCSVCHSNSKLGPFDHAKKTGWALNKHHINLSCAKCHGAKLPYKKVDANCTACHKNWTKSTFKHAVTGLLLDESHSDLECFDCHLKNNYGIKPNCTGCHDNYFYPGKKPGKLLVK
jgi:hypothetical protein